MTRLATTPAILGMIASSMVALGLPAGCSSNQSGLSLARVDGHAPDLDAPAGHGGGTGAGGAVNTGGVTGSGGVTAAGGFATTGGTAGAGGATRAGGATGSGGATRTGGMQDGGATGTGGATGSGGTTGTGGSVRTGGNAGTGGGVQTGGATGSGGVRQTGGTTATGGATATGGKTGTGGATQTGGATGAGGGTGTGGSVRTGGTTGTGGATQTGGTTGSGGTGGTGKICGGLAGYPCAAGEFCETSPGECCCDFFGTCAARPQVCPELFLPVCGCDGKTYGNDCLRQVAGVSKNFDGACPSKDAGAGGTTGTGGATATGGRPATGGTTTGGTGGTSTGGAGGSSGGYPECMTDNDCQLFSDCCSCLPVPVGTAMPRCGAMCIQSSCAARQIQDSEVACIAGRCTFSRACKPAGGICPIATPTPLCSAGQAPLFVGNCPAGGCAKVEDCSEVSSCDACAATSAAPTGLLCATFQTLPFSYHCVSTPPQCAANPTCACMGICSGGLSCVAPNSTTLTCQCPEC